MRFPTAPPMEHGSFSKIGLSLSAADIRIMSLQLLHGWMVARFPNETLTFTPNIFVLEVYNSYTDGGRPVFNMSLSPHCRAHVPYEFGIATRMEGGSFSKSDSRHSAAHTRRNSLQQLHGIARLKSQERNSREISRDTTLQSQGFSGFLSSRNGVLGRILPGRNSHICQGATVPGMEFWTDHP